MAKQKRHEKVSPQTKEEAMKAAMATQKPGQTKEQTKLIAQGIQKGIDHYKKQQKAKSRSLNKKIHKLAANQDPTQQNNIIDSTDIQPQPSNKKINVLPWVLLVSSWLFFLVYITVIETS